MSTQTNKPLGHAAGDVDITLEAPPQHLLNRPEWAGLKKYWGRVAVGRVWLSGDVAVDVPLETMAPVYPDTKGVLGAIWPTTVHLRTPELKTLMLELVKDQFRQYLQGAEAWDGEPLEAWHLATAGRYREPKPQSYAKYEGGGNHTGMHSDSARAQAEAEDRIKTHAQREADRLERERKAREAADARNRERESMRFNSTQGRRVRDPFDGAGGPFGPGGNPFAGIFDELFGKPKPPPRSPGPPRRDPLRPRPASGAAPWPWSVLGLKEGESDPQVIKKGYLLAAQTAHPDRGGTAESFRDLEAAYNVVKLRTPCAVCGQRKLARNPHNKPHTATQAAQGCTTECRGYDVR